MTKARYEYVYPPHVTVVDGRKIERLEKELYRNRVPVFTELTSSNVIAVERQDGATHEYRIWEIESPIIRYDGVQSYVRRIMYMCSLNDPFDRSVTSFSSKWYLVKDPDFKVGMHVN